MKYCVNKMIKQGILIVKKLRKTHLMGSKI